MLLSWQATEKRPYLEHRKCGALVESCTESLVLPSKANPDQPIPLLEVDRRRWIPGLYAHHTAVHLGWRPEVVLPDLHDPACSPPAQGQQAQAGSEFQAYAQQVALANEGGSEQW